MLLEIKMEQLYREMLATIYAHNREINTREEAENCLSIACKYWVQLKQILNVNSFESEKIEIHFFKKIKPKFTSQIQFFTILTEVLLFVPCRKSQQILFWKEELKRLPHYRERNRDFVVYYESKALHLDKAYFSRLTKEGFANWTPISYDWDINFCSSHDHLVRGLLAYTMYYNNVKEKLAKLEVEM